MLVKIWIHHDYKESGVDPSESVCMNGATSWDVVGDGCEEIPGKELTLLYKHPRYAGVYIWVVDYVVCMESTRDATLQEADIAESS
jgi:hypothetical protein